MSQLKSQVIHGVIWRSAEQFGTQIISLSVSLILARLLGPEEFGTVALLSIFLALSKCLVSGGLGISLVRKKDVDELDLNSVFYCNLTISVLMYLVLYVAAPVIASFYNKPILIPVLRVSALSLVLGGVNAVQEAVLSRRMLFARSFWITLPGTIVHGVVGIVMAYCGFGLWALVWSTLAGNLVATGLRWFLIGWLPAWQFSFQRLGALFRFGTKMLATSLIATFSDQLYGLLIGKWYSARDLAFFNRGDHIPQMLMNTVQASISGVTLPAFSKMQDDNSRLRNAVRRVLTTATFILCPMMLGLAAVSETLVRILLTDKWLPCVPYMRLMCFTCALWPMYVVNLQVVAAKGHGSLYLYLETAKKAALLLALLLTFRHGVFAIAAGRAALTPLCVLINSWPNRRLIGYSTWSQFRDVLPNFLVSGVMALCVVALGELMNSPRLWMELAAQLVCGIVVFAILALVFQRQLFHDTVQHFASKFLHKELSTEKA